MTFTLKKPLWGRLSLQPVAATHVPLTCEILTNPSLKGEEPQEHMCEYRPLESGVEGKHLIRSGKMCSNFAGG